MLSQSGERLTKIVLGTLGAVCLGLILWLNFGSGGTPNHPDPTHGYTHLALTDSGPVYLNDTQNIVLWVMGGTGICAIICSWLLNVSNLIKGRRRLLAAAYLCATIALLFLLARETILHPEGQYGTLLKLQWSGAGASPHLLIGRCSPLNPHAEPVFEVRPWSRTTLRVAASRRDGSGRPSKTWPRNIIPSCGLRAVWLGGSPNLIRHPRPCGGGPSFRFSSGQGSRLNAPWVAATRAAMTVEVAGFTAQALCPAIPARPDRKRHDDGADTAHPSSGGRQRPPDPGVILVRENEHAKDDSQASRHEDGRLGEGFIAVPIYLIGPDRYLREDRNQQVLKPGGRGQEPGWALHVRLVPPLSVSDQPPRRCMQTNPIWKSVAIPVQLASGRSGAGRLQQADLEARRSSSPTADPLKAAME